LAKSSRQEGVIFEIVISIKLDQQKREQKSKTLSFLTTQYSTEMP
jgi:hypothetical protein